MMNDVQLLKKHMDLKKIAKTILIVFVILQPIFDIYMSLFDDKITIMSTSVATIARFLIVFVMTLFVIADTRKSKLTLCFVIYAFLILVYAVIHHFNALGFSVDLALAEYDFLGELFYIARMCIPIALIYVIYNIKLKYEDIRLMISAVSAIISFVIIISNLFKFGYVAYSLNKIVIPNNMISWFTGVDTNWKLLTCRGLFQSTNQLSAVMIIILPMLMHICFKEKKVIFWALSLMHIIAMINLGTRIAAVGGILIFAAMLFLFVLENIIYKQSFRKQSKNALCFLMVSVVIALIFFKSPMIKRSLEAPLFSDMIYGEEEFIENEDEPENDDNQYAEDEKENYILYNYSRVNISPLYILKAYPYDQDSEFWYNLIKNVPNSEYMGNRRLRVFLIDRILERDDRISNYFFGISHTRSSSFIWPERDIETHFDSLGIVGIILFIGPYFLGIIIGVWHFFKRFRYNLKISYCVYLIASVLGLATAYFSGHVLNEIFPFTMLSVMVGMTITTALNSQQGDGVNN